VEIVGKESRRGVRLSKRQKSNLVSLVLHRGGHDQVEDLARNSVVYKGLRINSAKNGDW
jgi:hypothetical protein